MLHVEQISFSYGGQATISDISFSLQPGKHLAVIGESGSGKSTLLKLLYGIHDLTSGSIAYRGAAVLGPKFKLIPGPEVFQYLAQDFGLMPYISASENIGKFLSNVDKKKKADRIHELLDIVEMSDFADTHVKLLSGGQQQRIALAKALAPLPELLLLDEPFSQIDAFRGNSLRRKIYGFLKDQGISCITATHDSNDVLSFADEVLVMQHGQKVDFGKPREVYRNPANRYVASLFDEVSEIPRHLLAPAVDRDETLLLYPHLLKAVNHEGLKVIVDASYYRGTHYLISGHAGNLPVFFNHPVPFEKGMGVFVGLK